MAGLACVVPILFFHVPFFRPKLKQYPTMRGDMFYINCISPEARLYLCCRSQRMYITLVGFGL